MNEQELGEEKKTFISGILIDLELASDGSSSLPLLGRRGETGGSPYLTIIILAWFQFIHNFVIYQQWVARCAPLIFGRKKMVRIERSRQKLSQLTPVFKDPFFLSSLLFWDNTFVAANSVMTYFHVAVIRKERATGKWGKGQPDGSPT